MEKTLILIKPDALQRGLIGNIITRFENKGLNIIGMKMINLNDDILVEHYKHHSDKPFFPRIKTFMKSTPVIAMCLKGKECVKIVRDLCGETNSRNAKPGTIRGDFAMSIQCNLVHASDSPETAKNEIERFFNQNELYEYDFKNLRTIYSEDEL